MFRWIGVAALGLAVACSGAASAETAYAFKVQNTSAGPLTVTVDSKAACALAAGETCTVSLNDADSHAFAYSLAGATPAAFAPGNIEMVDVCKIDAQGAHCIDPTGAPTN